jgi:transposase
MFVRPVISMDQASWTASHVEAFAFFGGAPARLVPDNLKTGVDKPDLYDPKLNRAYAELAAHYGVLIDPARARKPKDKPRVERQMPYIRDSWWKGREFTSLAEMQASALHWCREVAGVRKPPRAGRPHAGRGVRRGRGRDADPAAGLGVHPGGVVAGQLFALKVG